MRCRSPLAARRKAMILLTASHAPSPMFFRMSRFGHGNKQSPGHVVPDASIHSRFQRPSLSSIPLEEHSGASPRRTCV
jgi:hypothetical protein